VWLCCSQALLQWPLPAYLHAYVLYMGPAVWALPACEPISSPIIPAAHHPPGWCFSAFGYHRG
jgi:hypothetical protein